MALDVSISELIESLAGGARARYTVTLDFNGVIVEARTQSAELARALERYFDAFIAGAGEPDILVHAIEGPPPEVGLALVEKPPDPGKDKIKEEYADLADGRLVRKRLTGMVFIFGGDSHYALGPCLENSNQVVNFINNRFIAHMLDQGCLLGHASAVLKGGRGLALAGTSGAGKSTLSLHLMSLGCSLVSNDRLMIRRDPGAGLEMIGVAKLPRINPGTALNNKDLEAVVPPADRERFLAMPTDRLWELEHKFDVYIGRCFGPGRFKLRSPMDGLVVLTWKRGGGECVFKRTAARERPDLLEHFRKEEGLFYLPRDIGEKGVPAEAYAELLGDCPLYEFGGGVDFGLAAKECAKILEAGE